MKKRVLHILNSNSYSGAENVVITIINNMNNLYEFAYACPEGPIAHILKKNKINYIPMSSLSIKEIRRVIVFWEPHIIHTHDFRASIKCGMVEGKIPIISHLHNNSPWMRKLNLYSFAFLISSLRYKKILGVSSSVIEEYVFGSAICKKWLNISNPFDYNRVNVLSKMNIAINNVDVVFIGRLSAQKNPQRFIRIASKVIEELPNTNFYMIGNGDLEKECAELIKMYEAEENIHLLGFMDNPFPVLAKSKLLVITSEWEGYGLVAIEALSLGVPVLASPVGGLTTIVNNKCGRLCLTDSEFIEEIKEVLENSEYADLKNNEALKRFNELYNNDNYFEILSKAYNEVLLVTN